MLSPIQKFRQQLQSGPVPLGPMITFGDPAVTEALAGSVDFLWYDLEHTALGLESLQAHLIAARAGGVPALVRVPSGALAWTKRVLDIGADAVILPRVYDVDEVRAFVSNCRYPPEGTRGFGPHRPANYGRNFSPEFAAQANREIFVIVQIETIEAVQKLDEILKVPGVDSIVIGPMDLSGSMGMLGRADHPKVQEVIQSVLQRTRKAGIHAGIGLWTSPAPTVQAIEWGANWVMCGADYAYMIGFADRFYREVRAANQ
jgi:2-keto-3-deoxy-L-rhamnonate aldolase RhmA